MFSNSFDNITINDLRRAAQTKIANDRVRTIHPDGSMTWTVFLGGRNSDGTSGTYNADRTFSITSPDGTTEIW